MTPSDLLVVLPSFGCVREAADTSIERGDGDADDDVRREEASKYLSNSDWD